MVITTGRRPPRLGGRGRGLRPEQRLLQLGAHRGSRAATTPPTGCAARTTCRCKTFSNAPAKTVYLTGGYEAIFGASGCLTGEDDGVVQYASIYACNGSATASYNNCQRLRQFLQAGVLGLPQPRRRARESRRRAQRRRLRRAQGVEPDLAESLQVTATARLNDGDLRQAVGGFVYGKPSAKLTGRYRDALRDGNVVISAEVEVTEVGRFHLAGTVHSLAGEPIGTAQSAVELTPGRHWIGLSFYGLMFHDRQVAGPFRLGSLAFATTTRMPNALNDLVENAHVTRAYRLVKLNGKAFGDARLADAAGRLEAEARRLDLGTEVQQP